MSASRLLLAVPAAIVLATGLACGGLGSAPDSPSSRADVEDDAGEADPEPSAAASAEPAAPRPDGLADNLALSTNTSSFPLLSGGENPDFTEGDPIVGVAKLSAPARSLAVDGDEGDFVAVLHEDGKVLHSHAWTWKTSQFEADSPIVLVNLVPSKDLGGKGEDWSPGFARALDGLEGTHELTFQLQSPHADPPVIAIAEFSYTAGGAKDYGAYAKDLEDFMAGRGKYAPKPRATRSSGGGGGGGATVSTNLKNNCSNNARVVLNKPDGSRSSVVVPATRVKTVTVPMGTRLDVLDADSGARLNQRLKALDRDFYDGMTSNLCR